MKVHGKDAVMSGYDSDQSEDKNSTNIDTTTNHTTTHHQQNQNNQNNTSNSNASMVGAASPNHTNQIDQKPYITNNNNLTNSSLLHSSSSGIASASSSAVLPGQTSSLSSHFSHYSSAYPNVTSSTGVGLHNSTLSNTTGGLTNPISTSSYSHQPTSAAPQHSAHHMSYMGYSSLDVKPSHLADWYSHAGMTSMAMHGMAATTPGMTSASGRYDSNPHHAGKVPYHVAAALPTPPSTGHSPIQSLSNHLNLLPSTTSAVAYT